MIEHVATERLTVQLIQPDALDLALSVTLKQQQLSAFGTLPFDQRYVYFAGTW